MPPSAAARPEPTDAYDQVPYESYAYPHTHPYHSATIATLFGLTPADFRKARILEIGCAGGGNLFSLALTYPHAHFTGIDLSHEQIAQADHAKAALCLRNIDFIRQDIGAFSLAENKGKYDYIICHGVLSWVPQAVRDKIFEVCRTCLSEDGLAVISYNTLPGWNAVRSLREMMLFHVSRFGEPAEKIRQARLLLDFLAETVPSGRAGYLELIEEERALLRNTNDAYLFHDHLEETNSQFYFHEFVAMAGDHGLVYVGDSTLASMFIGNMKQKAMETLQTVNDVVLQEQYMDFINNRRFRTSILCGKGKTLNRQLKSEAVMMYHLTSVMAPPEGAVDPAGEIRFSLPNGNFFTTRHEIAGTLFLELASAGQKPLAAKDLVQRTARRLNLQDAKPVEDILIQHGINLALHGFIALHLDSAGYKTELSDKPVVFPYARYQAAQPGCVSVTNMLHSMVRTDHFANLVMTLLDGTRTVPDVVETLVSLTLEGKITVQRDDVPAQDEAVIRTEIARNVALVVQQLAGQALLAA